MGRKRAEAPLPAGATYLDSRGMAERKAAFLDALRRHYTAAAAAREAGVDRTRPYDWRRTDPAFAAAWDTALSEGRAVVRDQIEDHMVDLALNTDNPLPGFFLLKKLDNSYRDNHRPEPQGQAARRTGAADDLPESIRAIRELHAQLGLGDWGLEQLRAEGLPLLPEGAGGAICETG